jgi:hypothetical protein
MTILFRRIARASRCTNALHVVPQTTAAAGALRSTEVVRRVLVLHPALSRTEEDERGGRHAGPHTTADR